MSHVRQISDREKDIYEAIYEAIDALAALYPTGKITLIVRHESGAMPSVFTEEKFCTQDDVDIVVGAVKAATIFYDYDRDKNSISRTHSTICIRDDSPIHKGPRTPYVDNDDAA